MNSDEFAASIKTKYPQYSKVDNATLTEKVIAKYPQYASQVEGRKSSSGQTIYPPQEEMGKGRAAWEAVQTPVPGLSQVHELVADKIPGAIAEKTGALGERVGGTAGKAISGVGVAAAGALGTAGELIPKTVADVGAQVLAEPLAVGGGAALKAAGKALTTLKALSGRVGTAMLARDIGVAEPFIDLMKKNPGALKDLSNDMNVVMDHAKSMSDVMKRGVDRLGGALSRVEERYVDALALSGKQLKTAPVADVLGRFTESIFRKGVQGAERRVGGKFVRPISPVDVVKGPEAEKVLSYVDELRKLKNGHGNVVDYLRLKRALAEDIAWNKEEAVAKKIGTSTNTLLTNLYHDLQKKINTLSPELSQASSEYARARKSYDVLQRKVFGGTPEEAYRRVRLRIQNGVAPQALIERAAQINASSEKAMKALVDKVAAQQFAPYIRKGIAGGAMGVSGALAATTAAATMGGHGLYPLLADLAAAAVSSPRLAAAGIRGEAAVSSAMSELTKQVGRANPALYRTLLQGLSDAAQARKKAADPKKKEAP